jgi:DNA-binding NarL/FixJ family response regulator
MPSQPTLAPRIVVLKADRFYGDMICRNVKQCWRGAQVEIFQKGFDALESIQATMPDMFITGVKIEDMDGLEHLEPFVERRLPILVVTSRRDARTIALLRELRYNGIFDVKLDGDRDFSRALELVLEGKSYISESFLPHMKPPRRITLDELTQKEQMVLSAIGDGSDDQQAAQRLGISPHTVNTHRKSIMGKLRLHQKGELVCYAVQMGYVHISPRGVTYPGFQRRLFKSVPRAEGPKKHVA